ncbi:TetR/AcrR family transcriptional regulator [Prescottella sp. R16]|uniref:TetR/AcrR family transcriptional regulator n=1 Tax=Prescottella sp. R16 TaxID=3064529 RepID=UPI00272EE837|nr:TetR/AcrR family transcriptional regulator [Prescottella sp. R16]
MSKTTAGTNPTTRSDGAPDPFVLRDLPSTPRGLRTRTALIQAARVVFERDGYLDTRLTDITKECNCASGTFYTYFASKEEICAAVLEEAKEDMLHPGMGREPESDDPYLVLEASNRAYLAAYARNAKLMGLLEQAAHADPWFREYRNRRSETFVLRNARGIANLQERGIADPELDPLTTSRALSGMVSSLAYSVYVLEETYGASKPVPFDDLVHTVTRIWANALRLHREG